MKKLSFGISCYNFENYIEDCVESVISQKTNFDFDIIIRDDCSTDGSRDVLKRIQNKYSGTKEIKIIFGDKNVGTNENVRLLLSECEGEYIALLDGDDHLTVDDKLQLQVEFLENNPEFALHCTSYRYIDIDGRVITEEGYWNSPVKDEVVLEELLDQNYISFGRLFRNMGIAERLTNSDYYNEFIYDDWALNFEILKNGKARCDRQWVTGHYRITGTGVMTSNTVDEVVDRNAVCREKLLTEYHRYKAIQ